MKIAELVLKYVEALAWPLTVLVLVWCLRAQIREAFGRMTRLETPAGAVEFAAEARAVREQAEEALGAGTLAPPVLPWTPAPAPAPEPLPWQQPPTYGGPPPGAPAAPAGPAAPASPGAPPPAPRQPEPEPAGDRDQDWEDVRDGDRDQEPDDGGWALPRPGQPQPVPAGPGTPAGGGGWGGGPPPAPGPVPKMPAGEAAAELLQMARELAGKDPSTALILAWAAVEGLADDVLQRASDVDRSRSSMLGKIRALRVAGLSPGAFALLERLRMLLEKTPRVYVTSAAARDFIDSCETLVPALEALR